MSWFDDDSWNRRSNRPDSAEDAISPIGKAERAPSTLHVCERCGCLIPKRKLRWCASCSSIARNEQETRRKARHDE